MRPDAASRAYNTADALALARKCLTDGRIIVTKHARERLDERDFDLQDVRKVLRWGQISDQPEHDVKHGNWKYRIQGQSIDNRELSVVICFGPEPNTLVITIFPDKR